MHDTIVEELWFPATDLLPLVEHRPPAVPGRPAAQLPEQLLLMAQGRLRYLVVSDGAPPLLAAALVPTAAPDSQLSEQQLDLLADLRQLRGERLFGLTPPGPHWRQTAAAPWRRP